MGTAKKSEFSEQQMAHLFLKKKPKSWKVRPKKDIIYGQREKDISHFENPKKHSSPPTGRTKSGLLICGNKPPTGPNHPPPPQKKVCPRSQKNQKKSKK